MQPTTIPSVLVPAASARDWLLSLRRVGVGYRAVEKASGISRSTLCRIRGGYTESIPSTTERLILAVDATCLCDYALVAGGATAERIDDLIERGYSRRQLAAWLHCSFAWTYAPKKWVTARMESRVERLCRLLDAGLIRRAS